LQGAEEAGNHFYIIFRARYKEMHVKGSGLRSFAPLQSSLAEVIYKGK